MGILNNEDALWINPLMGIFGSNQNLFEGLVVSNYDSGSEKLGFYMTNPLTKHDVYLGDGRDTNLWKDNRLLEYAPLSDYGGNQFLFTDFGVKASF